MPTITLLEPIHRAGTRILESVAHVHHLSGPSDPGLAKALADSDALIVRSTAIGRDLLVLAPRLRVIGRHGAGTDNIDRDYAEEHGIQIVNTPRSNTESVAEYTVAALMHLFKRFPEVEHALRSGRFQAAGGSLPGQVDRAGLIGREVSGATLGLVGAGAIGRAVARRAIALGMRVLAFDPYAEPTDLSALGIEPVTSLMDMLPQLDALSLHVPGGGGALIGETELAALRPGAVLINAARGGLVDEVALAAALESGALMGAAVDVFSPEPPHPESPLFSAPRTLLTPHMAAMTAEALERMAVDVATFTLDALRDLEEGR